MTTGISYNMGKRDLLDIYALARGSQAEGVGIYIRQIPIAHVISVKVVYNHDNVCSSCPLRNIVVYATSSIHSSSSIHSYVRSLLATCYVRMYAC